MSDILSFTVGKFTFTVPTDRLYHRDGLWLREQDERLIIGVTDYFQQESGDVAFAETAAAGTTIAAGDRLANIETIKVDNEVASPISGAVVAVNDKLQFEAEVINQDCYGDGWLVALEPTNWAAEREMLLSPMAYLEYSRAQGQEAGQ